MGTQNVFKQLTNQFKLSKTLRFELIPVGRTAESIKENDVVRRSESDGLAGNDVERSKQYKQLKKLLDGMHRCFFDDALNMGAHNKKLRDALITEIRGLQEQVFNESEKKKIASPVLLKIFDETMKKWQASYCKRLPELLEKEISGLEEKMNACPRKAKYYSAVIDRLTKKKSRVGKIADRFSAAHTLYSKNEPPLEMLEWLVREGRLDETLMHMDLNREAAIRVILPAFDRFSTYLAGFNENRANVYNVADPKKTSILYRLYLENLVFFIENSRLLAQLLQRRTKFEQTHPNVSLPKIKHLNKALAAERASLADILKVEGYLQFMNQPGIDRYNRILGGEKADVGEVREKGINQFVKETRDAAGAGSKDFPLLRPLYKQILSLREKDFVAQYTTDQELLADLKKIAKTDASDFVRFKESVFTFTGELVESDLNALSLRGKQIIALSVACFGKEQWNVLTLRLLAQPAENRSKNKDRPVSFAKLSALAFRSDLDEHRVKPEFAQVRGNLEVEFFRTTLSEKSAALETARKSLLDSGILSLKNLDTHDRNDANKGGGRQVAIIKAYLDARNDLAGFLKRWMMPPRQNDPDLVIQWNALLGKIAKDRAIFSVYNKARNYLTRKHPTVDKIKITFQAPTLLAGWDQNKETANFGVLFEREGLFYLGILHPQHKKSLEYAVSEDDNVKIRAEKAKLKKDIMAVSGEPAYRKMVYKLLPDPQKMLPKVVFSKKGRSNFEPPKDIIDIYENDRFKTNPKARSRLINYYREVLPLYPGWACYRFKPDTFKPGDQYENWNEFFNDVAERGYQITFDSIKAAYIDQLVAEGKFYLFQLYNKDFSTKKNLDKRPSSQRHDNLHTSYWKLLFESENLNNPILRLNGGAEMFFRPASVEYSAEKRRTGHHATDGKVGRRFDYAILKDRRYSLDKFTFHCPITLNCFAPAKPKSTEPLNQRVNNLIRKAEEINIIGIDRGERHLLHYCVINSQGDILEQGNWNSISNGFIPQGQTKERRIDYRERLEQKGADREEARLAWTTIENIKELKAGYLSQIVHELAKLVIRHNAVVVLEYLNQGFKRGRFKIEKQVYQKFEVALMNKFSYLVFKEIKARKQVGHYLNAYQLTLPAANLEKMLQNGIVFYTIAAYTSKTDPVTGWMKNVYQSYQSAEKACAFWASFDSIRYNTALRRFEFTYTGGRIQSERYGASDAAATEERKTWTLCSCVERSDKDGKLLSMTKRIQDTLDAAGVDYRKKRDIQPFLAGCPDKAIQQDLMRHFNAIANMRVTAKDSRGEWQDFIQSPVEPFFDTRKADARLPMDSDANGAYNIARKGLCMLKRIRGNKKKIGVDKAGWCSYVQDPKTVRKQKTLMG